MDTITLNVPTLPCVGLAAAAGLLACKLIAPRRRADDTERGPLPAWLNDLEDDESYERVRLPEWDNGAA